MTKSYVTVEKQVCPVCGKLSDTGALLMDKRMRDRFEKETATGWGMCEEHQEIVDAGYVILVGAVEPHQNATKVQPDRIERTGELVYLRREVAEQMINVPFEDMMFVPTEVIEEFQKQAKSELH